MTPMAGVKVEGAIEETRLIMVALRWSEVRGRRAALQGLALHCGRLLRSPPNSRQQVLAPASFLATSRSASSELDYCATCERLPISVDDSFAVSII